MNPKSKRSWGLSLLYFRTRVGDIERVQWPTVDATKLSQLLQARRLQTLQKMTAYCTCPCKQTSERACGSGLWHVVLTATEILLVSNTNRGCILVKHPAENVGMTFRAQILAGKFTLDLDIGTRPCHHPCSCRSRPCDGRRLIGVKDTRARPDLKGELARGRPVGTQRCGSFSSGQLEKV